MNLEFSLEQRTFASGSIIPTCEESYNVGFKNGFFWPDAWNYRPGGPALFGAYTRDKERYQVWAKASRAAYDAWHKGWTDGNRSKQEVRKCGVILPSWSDVKEFRKAVD